VSNVVSLHAHIDARWSEYVAAQKRADETGASTDIEAARALWAAWLTMFAPSEAKAVSLSLAKEMG